ncbi:MAG: hypothetical protein U0T73_03605 [Chitinophagales bacterium]
MLQIINQNVFIVNHKISPATKGYLMLKDYLGEITFQTILHNPESEVTLSHLRSGFYQLELVVGNYSISQAIFKK